MCSLPNIVVICNFLRVVNIWLFKREYKTCLMSLSLWIRNNMKKTKNCVPITATLISFVLFCFLSLCYFAVYLVFLDIINHWSHAGGNWSLSLVFLNFICFFQFGIVTFLLINLSCSSFPHLWDPVYAPEPTTMDILKKLFRSFLPPSFMSPTVYPVHRKSIPTHGNPLQWFLWFYPNRSSAENALKIAWAKPHDICDATLDSCWWK